MKQATDTMTTDPELYMRQVVKDVKDGSFHLNESYRYMSFNIFMRIQDHYEDYRNHCEIYDAERFEDYAERMDCILASVKPKWRGYVIVYILCEFISVAYTNATFDDRDANHILFWKNHLFHQPYIGTITRYSQYTDLLLDAIRMDYRDMDDIRRKAVVERYVTYLARAFENFRTEELVAAKERLAPYKEGIIAAAWHPKRVEKWLEAGMLEAM
jgi:hypothetical protein